MVSNKHVCRHGGTMRIPKAACILCMRAERNSLLAVCKALVDHCCCTCGGIEGGEVVAQPCVICDSARRLIARCNQQQEEK